MLYLLCRDRPSALSVRKKRNSARWLPSTLLSVTIIGKKSAVSPPRSISGSSGSISSGRYFPAAGSIASVRVPASKVGVFGFESSHTSVSSNHCLYPLFHVVMFKSPAIKVVTLRLFYLDNMAALAP